VIREHLRDFLAIAGLMVIGLLTTGVILSQQQQPYPSWIPVLGDDRFELKAELSTAQAVTPGQGQTVNISGVKAGDISEVNLVDGRAVVTMLVEEKFAPLIHDDASVLLRPRTGLQDMTIELDPGTEDAPIVEDGATIPLAQTKPNVQPDEFLASLDGDTRDYLQLLIQGGAEGLGGRGKQLSAGLRQFEPLGKYLAEIGNALSARRHNIAQTITSLKELGDELARTDVRLSEWVTAQSEALGDFAAQEAALRETLQEAPSTLTATQRALASGEEFANVLGPTSEALIPAAQAFAPAQEAAQDFFNATEEPIRTQIRPFARSVQKPVKHLSQASKPLAKTTQGLEQSFTELNRLFDSLAYDPPGSHESNLFWLAWLNHNTNNMFLTQSADGPLRRGAILQNCQTAFNAETFSSVRPFIRTLQQITNVTPADVICPLDGTNLDAPLIP
jgi:phospholipid/cholesterol/gamma-HCH transport system substrate-binding protein